MAKRKWHCPNDEHPAVLAPEKGMRRDDVRRFCLPCSEQTGRLVERVCPVADRKQACQSDRRKARAKKRAQKKSPFRRRAARVRRETKSEELRRARALMRARLEAVDSARGPHYSLSGINMHEQLDRLLETPSVPRALRVLKPKLHVRQCENPPRRWGFAAFRKGRGYLSVSVWAGIGPGEMLGHLCHELAHLVAWHECVARKPHGPDWRAAYVKLAREGYRVRIGEPVGNSRCDLDDVVALALSPVGREMMRLSTEES